MYNIYYIIYRLYLTFLSRNYTSSLLPPTAISISTTALAATTTLGFRLLYNTNVLFVLFLSGTHNSPLHSRTLRIIPKQMYCLMSSIPVKFKFNIIQRVS